MFPSGGKRVVGLIHTKQFSANFAPRLSTAGGDFVTMARSLS